MATAIRDFDWTTTPLGPIETWPTSLKTAVQIGQDSAFATTIWWGPDLVQLHNDASLPVLRAKHPAALGRPAREVWADAWAIVGPLFEQVLTTGEPVMAEDFPLQIEPDDPSGIETGTGTATATFTLCCSALRDDHGAIAGIQAVAVETTGKSRHATILRSSEELQTFALQLSDALRPIHDPVDVQAVAVQLLGERLQTDRAYYVEIDEDQESLVIERHFVRNDVPSLVGRYDLSTFPWVGPAFRSGEPVVIHDTWTTPLIPDPARPAMDDIKVRAFIAAPLVKDDRLVAALCVTDIAPRTWTPEDIALIQATADRTWAAVEQARAEQRLRQSEEQYRTLFDSIDEGFCIIEMIFDADGTAQDYRFLQVNPAFEQHTGMKNVTGRTMKQIIPEHESDWFHIYGHIALTGEPMRFVNEAAGLGDQWFELNAFRIGDPALRHVAVLFTNITERTLAETSLRASEALFRGFAEASADTLWIIDAATRELEYLSPAFERIWGEPRETIMRDIVRWHELVHDDDRERVTDHIQRALAGETVVTEYRIVRQSDSTLRWIRDTGFPILDEYGNVARVAGIAQDVTGRKRAEAEREEFIDAAAHDLKTPLTLLRGQAQLLLRRARRETFVSHEIVETRLTQIDVAASRMVAVIDEMLDAAHLRADRPLVLRVATTDLVELVESAVEDARRTDPRQAIFVQADESSLKGEWDAVRLGRVIGNLLGNAIKFSPEGGDIIVNVARETDPDNREWAVLSVADRGIGIPAADLPQLFQRFRRAGNTMLIPGTGIGLAGARQIVEQHGGTLTVTSEEGRGSVFVARIPITQSSAAEVREGG